MVFTWWKSSKLINRAIVAMINIWDLWEGNPKYLKVVYLGKKAKSGKLKGWVLFVVFFFRRVLGVHEICKQLPLFAGTCLPHDTRCMKMFVSRCKRVDHNLCFRHPQQEASGLIVLKQSLNYVFYNSVNMNQSPSPSELSSQFITVCMDFLFMWTAVHSICCVVCAPQQNIC